MQAKQQVQELLNKLPDDCTIDEDTKEAIHFLPEVAHSFISCPSCGSADFRVDRGRGLTISSIEFESLDGGEVSQ